MRTVIVAACCVAVMVGVVAGRNQPIASEQTSKGSAMDRIAEQYVRLVLAMGQHDADYVDAYYGPPAWKAEAAATKVDLPNATITRNATGMMDVFMRRVVLRWRALCIKR